MMTPIKDGNKAKSLRTEFPKYKPWFYVDESFSDSEEIKKDTQLYMETSRLRVISFLDSYGIPRSRYKVYTDQSLDQSHTVVPAMRHSFHGSDFAFDFRSMLLQEQGWRVKEVAAELNLDDKKASLLLSLCEKAERYASSTGSDKDFELFYAAVHEEPDEPDYMISSRRRENARFLMQIYNKRKSALLDAEDLRYRANDELIESLKTGTQSSSPSTTPQSPGVNSPNVKALIYSGAAFTEVLRIITEAPKSVLSIIAMAGTQTGQSNLLGEQFNILLDKDSAEKVFELAVRKEIDLTLLSTECVKDSSYSLTKSEFETICKDAGQEGGRQGEFAWNLYAQWSPGNVVNIFDLLTVMTVNTELYKDMLYFVSFKRERGEAPEFKFTRGNKVSSASKGLKMFWYEKAGKDHTSDCKDTWKGLLRDVLKGPTGKETAQASISM